MLNFIGLKARDYELSKLNAQIDLQAAIANLDVQMQQFLTDRGIKLTEEEITKEKIKQLGLDKGQYAAQLQSYILEKNRLISLQKSTQAGGFKGLTSIGHVFKNIWQGSKFGKISLIIAGLTTAASLVYKLGKMFH